MIYCLPDRDIKTKKPPNMATAMLIKIPFWRCAIRPILLTLPPPISEPMNDIDGTATDTSKRMKKYSAAHIPPTKNIIPNVGIWVMKCGLVAGVAGCGAGALDVGFCAHGKRSPHIVQNCSVYSFSVLHLLQLPWLLIIHNSTTKSTFIRKGVNLIYGY